MKIQGSFHTTGVSDYHRREEAFNQACKNGRWIEALDLLQKGPVPELALIDAMKCLGEAMCLQFLQAARNHGPFKSEFTSVNILKIAVENGMLDLARAQIKAREIPTWGADMALKIAAESNNRPFVDLLLESSLCTQQGINVAALAAAESGATDSILEFLVRNAISGTYVHPMESYLDHALGTPLEECVWSVLIREAGRKGHWDIAQAVASCKPYELTKYDLNFLAIGAASAGKGNVLKDILSKTQLEPYHKEEARRAAHYHGQLNLLPLLS